MPKVLAWAKKYGTTLASLPLLAVSSYLIYLQAQWPMVHDTPLLNFAVQQLRHGKRPYIDFFEMNFPGVYAIHYLASFFSDNWDHVTQLLHLATLLMTLAGTALILRRSFKLSRFLTVCSCTFVVFLVGGLGAYHAAQRDFFLVPLILGLLGLACSRVDPPAANQTWHRQSMIFGILLGLASTIKPHSLVFGLLWLFFWPRASSIRHYLVAMCGRMVLAFASVWLGVLAGLWLLGSLTSFLALLVDFVPIYGQIDMAVVSGVAQSWWQVLVVADAFSSHPDAILRNFLMIFALWALIFLPRPQKAMAITYLLALLAYYMQKKGWSYHAYPALVMTALMAALALAPSSPKWARLGMVGVLLWWCPKSLPNRFEVIRYPYDEYDRKLRHVRDAVAAIKEIAPQSIQIFDTAEGGAHTMLLLEKDLPTSLFYDFPLFLDQKLPELSEKQKAYLTVLKLTLLQELFVARPDMLAVWTRGWPNLPANRFASIPDLAAWVDTHYRLERANGLLMLYVRRDFVPKAN